MKKAFTIACIIGIALWVMRANFSLVSVAEKSAPVTAGHTEITGTIGRGESFFDVFRKWKLDTGDLFKLREASAGIHRLRDVQPGQPYKIVLDDDGLKSFRYWIDDDTILSVERGQDDFCAAREAVRYEKAILDLGGVISDNLISSMGKGRDNLMLALQLSDIFAWDIDFTSDLRNGDAFRIVVEGLYRDGEFRKYGDILSAEFSNNGETYRAYRFEHDGNADYYDAGGKSLKKAFLKAPLSFRRISSSFSRSRFHPVLKKYRPHHGLDYAAAAGTPVSAVGGGTVLFAGPKGQYGNLVTIKHPNGWQTSYGHLSRIEKGVRRGAKVEQGMIIGRVGATGLATGPHLHYEVRIGDRPVNPLELKLPRGESIPEMFMADFKRTRNSMDTRLASTTTPVLAFAERKDR